MRKLKKILGIPISFLTLFLCMFPALKASATTPPATSIYLPVPHFKQIDFNSCWAEASAMVAAYYHKDTTDREQDIITLVYGSGDPTKANEQIS